jgi:hypothetical protein
MYLIIFLLSLPLLSFAADRKVFTDDDLQQYQYGHTPRETTQEINNPLSGVQGKKDAKWWCDTMTAAKDRLEQAQKALIDAGMTEVNIKNTYGKKYIGASAVADAKIEENKAKDEVRSAQDALKKLEDDAHREGVPPGWLYCNY